MEPSSPGGDLARSDRSLRNSRCQAALGHPRCVPHRPLPGHVRPVHGSRWRVLRIALVTIPARDL